MCATSISTMKPVFKVTIIVLIQCLITYMSLSANLDFFLQVGSGKTKAMFHSIQGLSYLFYPLIGWIADVKFTRYKMMILSLVINIIAGGAVLVTTIVGVVVTTDICPQLTIVSAVLIIPGIIALSMFQANAIQFGMDQLIGASSVQLSSFIHWYYWLSHLGHFVFGHSNLLLVWLASQKYHLQPHTFTDYIIHNTSLAMAIYTAILVAANIALIYVLQRYKQDFFVQRAGTNPMKMAYQVLSYSWKHTCPENRSAFTYWEEDVPPRIDLGKNKYGGPFTNEEVEDVKTFLQLSLLIVSLFGFHLLEDGNSPAEQMEVHSCPSIPMLAFIVVNKYNISSLTVLVTIPLYQCINKLSVHVQMPSMLTQIRVGSVLAILTQILYTVIVLSQPNKQTIVPCLKGDNPTTNCIRQQMNITYIHHTHCYPHVPYNDTDSNYVLFIVPQFLSGLCQVLVFMTVLEFICAQAPFTTQGMLIGFWYASLAIKYCVDETIKVVTVDKPVNWYTYQLIKAAMMLLSMSLLIEVSRRYRYRERDEIVPEQMMTEEIFERRFDMEEEYEKRLLAQWSS